MSPRAAVKEFEKCLRNYFDCLTKGLLRDRIDPMIVSMMIVLAVAAIIFAIALAAKGVAASNLRPLQIIGPWLSKGSKALLGLFYWIGRNLGQLARKLPRGFFQCGKDGVIARLGGMRFQFGHPDIRDTHLAKVCLTDKLLVIYSWFYYRKYGIIPLNKIRDVKIEKRSQARERYTKVGHPMAGVFDDFFRQKPRRSEYIISIRWEDERSIKHDTVFQFWGWLSPRHWVKAANIRNKILSAKPRVDSPDYAGPRMMVMKPSQQMEMPLGLVDERVDIRKIAEIPEDSTSDLEITS